MNSLIRLCLLFLILFFANACRQDAQEQGLDVDFKRTSNEVAIRLEGEPDRLNPLLSVSSYSLQVINCMFSYLLTVDPQTLEFIPELVKARPQVEEVLGGEYAGNVAYTFEIHETAVWDDGQPITGRDYVFVLKAIFNPKVQAQAARAYLSFIKDVAIDPNNPKRFTVYSKEKSIQDEEYISNAFAIMPEHFYDPEGLLREVELQDLLDESRANRLAAKEAILQRFADQISDQKYDREKGFIMGSGPYQLEEWITGQQIVLRRKDNWWGDALADRFPALRAYPERLVFKPVIDAVTTLAAIKAEELDVAYNIDPNSFEEVKSTAFVAERYNFHTVPSTAYYYVGVNTVNPKLSDKRVRRALAHIIDVDEIIQEVFNGYGVRMATPVLPDVDYLEKKLQPYAFDIEKARRLLAEAGWEDSNNDGIVDKVIDGKRTELSLQLIISANRETSLNLGLLIQENARRAGIDIQLTPQESSVLLSNLRKRDFELISAGRSLTPTLWNPKQNFHTQAGDNRFGFGDARSDAIIDEILVTLDKPRRDALYKELQGIIHDEAPEIPLFTPTNRLVIHKRFDTPTTVIFPGYVPQLIQLKAPFRREASLN